MQPTRRATPVGARLIWHLNRIIRVPAALMYLFSDACPTDWLVQGQDDTWHTIANFTFQSDPSQQAMVEAGASHAEVLTSDSTYGDVVRALQSELPSKTLRKWKTGPGYRKRFAQSLEHVARSHELMISACSFQERTLRNSKAALLASYNQHLGGIEGRGVGFEERIDGQGRLWVKHSFVNFNGYHEIKGLEGQVLVLLFMSWFAADQFMFHSNRLKAQRSPAFDGLTMTVVSDRLSGDDDTRATMELNLRRLIDPAGEEAPIVLTRSAQSDSFSGDLIVDNLAGLLNAAIADPAGVFGDAVRRSADTGIWRGWHALQESVVKLESTPALEQVLGSATG
jgi:hypothetical protein